MAKKISQLTQATEVKSDDVTVIVQDGETKKLPLNMMVTKQDIENKKVAGLAKLDEIEATYENDTYTPTITVKNKSSVKTGEGDGVDYSANVMDGPAKSAILKGQTLVNLIKLKSCASFISYNNGTAIFTNPTGSGSLSFSVMFKPSTKYIFRANFKCDSDWINTIRMDLFPDTYEEFKGFTPTPTPTNYYFTFTTPSDISTLSSFRIYVSTGGSGIATVSDIMILEYQEGMENWDIPYFEGIQSVKMPVLSTTGKNLFDKTKIIDNKYQNCNVNTGNFNISTNQNYMITDYIKVFPNTTYTKTNFNVYGAYYDQNKQAIKTTSIVSNTFTTPSNAHYIVLNFQKGVDDHENAQLELNTLSTTYEPYKSNILTVNEEVELRGIGDVKDELNLLTGELVQRFHKITIDENYSWTLDYEINGYLQFGAPLTVKGNTEGELKGASNGLPYGTLSGEGIQEQVLVFDHKNWITQLRIAINPSRLESPDVEGFIKYITNNPFELIYAKQPTVKTVDLIPSGTHPSTTPYCWKDGHIQLSSSELLPSLEYSVVTSRAGQINQNATMIVKNDKRIFDLEILLAGGLVNTTYQALTLQNQVETGLSKVSLNSETEPDYLLYHMIMKLIEEKAYKLDDLTEKVSVFYLYEKLSDEQFETIYSALYPFVEDEIVEEPVVEELPEVAEDEVIM